MTGKKSHEAKAKKTITTRANKNKYKQFIHTIMKATKTVESVEYWLEGCSSYFQETKEEFWNGINAGFRGFYFFKYTDGSYSDSIYAKSFERL